MPLAERHCSWCQKEGLPSFMGYAETYNGEPTHGMCRRHYRELMAEMGVVVIDDEQEETMREGEIEYEFDEGAANRAGGLNPRQESIVMASNGLAILYREFGQAAVDEAVRRAATASTVRQR